MKSYDKKEFYESSLLGEECIRKILKKNGLDIDSFDSILDFGCGCGRILRRWKNLNGKIYGSDYNAVLVDWCKKSLPFEVTMNNPQEKLDFEGNKFDFIYAISVFTHLNENLQNFWIDELIRILKPGGYLLITVHGYAKLRFRDHPDEKKKFESGEAIFVDTEYLGTNFCNSYHPEAYIRKLLKDRLTVIDYVHNGAKDANQDQYLLQKPKVATKANYDMCGNGCY